MIPISVIMAVSIGSLVRRVQTDVLYAIMLPIAVFGSVGVGWVVGAPVDLVVLAVLPFFLVTALLVVRMKQMLSEARIEIDRGDEKLEKA
jgi:Na+/melibiose symporter-like transporter